MSKKGVLFVSFLMLAIAVSPFVGAATITVKCTKYGTTRSSVSVAGAGITGRNYVIVASGGKAYLSGVKATKLDGTQVFNFDSNGTAITNGATRIPAIFIQGLRVDGYLRQALTHKLVGAIGAICVAK